MPAVVIEGIDSGAATGGEQNKLTLKYVITGASDYDEALEALEYESLSVIGTMIRKTYDVTPENRLAEAWKGTVEYGEPTRGVSPATSESTFEFDTTGAGSIRLYQALEHIADYPEGSGVGAGPNHDGAINVVRDQGGLKVEGMDLVPPSDAFAFSITHYAETVDLATLYALSRCINDDTWSFSIDGVSGSFAEKEVLFLGASGSKRDRGDWSVRYSFRAMPSLTSVTVGSITGVNKAGMDYLWCEYADLEDDNAVSLVKRPFAVHIERVWRLADLSLLDI